MQALVGDDIKRVCDDCLFLDAQQWLIENLSRNRNTCTFAIRTFQLPLQCQRCIVVTVYSRRPGDEQHHRPIYITMHGYRDQTLLYFEHSREATTLSPKSDYKQHPACFAAWLSVKIVDCAHAIMQPRRKELVPPAAEADRPAHPGSRPRLETVSLQQSRMSELSSHLMAI